MPRDHFASRHPKSATRALFLLLRAAPTIEATRSAMQTPERRGAAHALLRALKILAWTAFFAFAAVFLALRFWLLPQVERYQDEVVAALSRAVGLKVRIGSLRADWDGLRPRLTVYDLRVDDRDGREALGVPAVEPGVGWGTGLARELRLHTLAIEGPRLTVRRDTLGA